MANTKEIVRGLESLDLDDERILASLNTKEAKHLAEQEIMDIPGLSAVRKVLEKYNVTNVTIDFKLNVTCKFSKYHNPKKVENDQRKLH